jgi:hypothetical protein
VFQTQSAGNGDEVGVILGVGVKVLVGVIDGVTVKVGVTLGLTTGDVGLFFGLTALPVSITEPNPLFNERGFINSLMSGLTTLM